MRRLFGPEYSSDDAGDGPSSDSEDEYIHDRPVDGSEKSVVVGSPSGVKMT